MLRLFIEKDFETFLVFDEVYSNFELLFGCLIFMACQLLLGYFMLKSVLEKHKNSILTIILNTLS